MYRIVYNDSELLDEFYMYNRRYCYVCALSIYHAFMPFSDRCDLELHISFTL